MKLSNFTIDEIKDKISVLNHIDLVKNFVKLYLEDSSEEVKLNQTYLLNADILV